MELVKTVIHVKSRRSCGLSSYSHRIRNVLHGFPVLPLSLPVIFNNIHFVFVYLSTGLEDPREDDFVR